MKNYLKYLINPRTVLEPKDIFPYYSLKILGLSILSVIVKYCMF
jgi:hypothetical protein